MCARMGETQYEERTERSRVAVRRALALKIGEKRNPLGAARHGRGLVVELVIGLGIAGKLARELIAVPGECSAGAEHDTHEIPGVGHDVAERVRAKPRIDARLRHWREERSRRAPTGDGFTR